MLTNNPTPATTYDAPATSQHFPLILSVDDDPEISRTIEMRMRAYEVRVRQAFFGMQGFWEAIHELPDLILLDMGMPQGNGQFVLECLKNNPHSQAIPVIVLTGIQDDALRVRAFQLGATQFLRKPIRFDELVAEMGRFIELRPRNENQARPKGAVVRDIAPAVVSTAGSKENTQITHIDPAWGSGT